MTGVQTCALPIWTASSCLSILDSVARDQTMAVRIQTIDERLCQACPLPDLFARDYAALHEFASLCVRDHWPGWRSSQKWTSASPLPECSKVPLRKSRDAAWPLWTSWSSWPLSGLRGPFFWLEGGYEPRANNRRALRVVSWASSASSIPRTSARHVAV